MNASDQLAPSNPPQSQVLSTVRVMPRFVNRLCARLETAEPASGGISGLLFGVVEGETVVVQAFRSLTSSDIAAVQGGGPTQDVVLRHTVSAAETDPALGGMDLIGWYGFRPEAGLQQNDIDLYERRFGSEPGVALIIRRVDAAFLLFDFYSAAGHGKLTRNGYWCGTEEFSRTESAGEPVDIALHAHAERAIAPLGTTAVGVPVPERPPNNVVSALERREDPVAERREYAVSEQPRPEQHRPAPDTRRSRIWLYPAILFGLAAAGTFAVLVWPGRNIPGTSRPAGSDIGLNLHAEGQGDRILLTWNRHNAVARAATGANLYIDDGSQHRQIQFDGAQIAIGSVLYHPMSDDVRFRLEIQGKNGQSTAEGVRVLDGRNAPAKSVDAALTEPPPVKEQQAAKPTPQQHVWREVASSRPAMTSNPQRRVFETLPENGPSLTGSHNLSPEKFDLSRLRIAPMPRTNDRIPESPVKPKSEAAVAKRPEPSDKAPTRPGAGTETTSPPQLVAERTPPPDTRLAEPKTAPAGERTGSPQVADAERSSTRQTSAPEQSAAAQIPGQEGSLPARTPEPQSNSSSEGATPERTAPPAAPAPEPKPLIKPPAATAKAPANYARRYMPPKPEREVLPDVSLLPKSLVLSAGQVSVLVMVDRTGQVTSAQVEPGKGMLPRSLILAAERAAQQWVFEPARLDGQAVASQHSIVFQFGSR